MNIDPKAEFAGQPMLLVRDLVREVHRWYDGAFDAGDWAHIFAAGSPGDRERVLAELAICGIRDGQPSPARPARNPQPRPR